MSARQVLEALPAGRHYGAARDGQRWTMVGRSLPNVDEWTIVPPLSSLTFAWGAGGCEVLFSGGEFTMRPGDRSGSMPVGATEERTCRAQIC